MSSSRSKRVIPVALVACLSWPLSARAGDRALAEELFREGQTLMQAANYGEACPKLAESQRLDPSTGTLLNLGVCHERQGKLATAWAEFNDAKALALRDQRQDRADFAEQHIQALEPKLSRLTLELGPGADIEGLEVRLDDSVVGRPALGVAAPVDAGTHRVAASAPGKKPWSTSVELPNGPAARKLVIPALVDEPKSAPVPVSEPKDAAPATNTQRYVAYALGGLGVVGVGAGAVFGFSALSKFDDSKKQGCVDNQCPPAAADTRRDAKTAGNLSTAFFIAGGAMLAGGAVLYFTAPHAPDSRAPSAHLTLAPSVARIDVEAAW